MKQLSTHIQHMQKYHCIKICQQKNNRTLLSPKLQLNRKTCNHFLKSRGISELPQNFFEKYKYLHIPFFSLQSSRYVFNEQPCLKKQRDYMTIFYFYLVCFTFPISYSMIPFHLCFPVSQFLKPLSSIVEKLLCIHNLCIL